jgi:hypothetical protein
MPYNFNYYLANKDPFLKLLSDIVCIADNDNLLKLRNIYPAICIAHDHCNWDELIETDQELPLIYNNKICKKREFNIEVHNDNSRCEYEKGSFGSYLNRCNTGNFVSSMAKLIIESDSKNRSLIARAYPQMVAAYLMQDWKKAPEGFDQVYNSIPVNTVAFSGTPGINRIRAEDVAEDIHRGQVQGQAQAEYPGVQYPIFGYTGLQGVSGFSGVSGFGGPGISGFSGMPGSEITDNMIQARAEAEQIRNRRDWFSRLFGA